MMEHQDYYAILQKKDETTKDYVIESCPELNGKLLEDGYVLTYHRNNWVIVRPENIRRMDRLISFYSKDPKVWKNSEIEAILAYIVTELSNISGWESSVEK